VIPAFGLSYGKVNRFACGKLVYGGPMLVDLPLNFLHAKLYNVFFTQQILVGGSFSFGLFNFSFTVNLIADSLMRCKRFCANVCL